MITNKKVTKNQNEKKSYASKEENEEMSKSKTKKSCNFDVKIA